MDGDEAIAIVGIGCKFPGADNADEYWKLLLKAQCELKDIPRERFNVDAFYDENPNTPGKTYVRKAALIDRPFDWDNHLFGYNENEAAAMDPQQRYVLDCVHMALEDGGLTKKEMSGTNTSVYIGAMNADYQAATTDDEALLSNYSVTGNSQSIMSARVSYHYNLLGPSMTIDTACSSALVAIHLGSESIKSGESTMAICGGVSSILYPEMFITLSRARMASPTGLCQAFSADADGYARGEGCGVVVLEKFGDAIRNGHKIWGTIQTGCNQDGQTTKPITAPSGAQQIKLLQKIYKKKNIDPSHIQYIEAHGTGTPVGDPIETNSLGEFFKSVPVKMGISGKYRIIGSVKTNIGHLESAAGVAGLIKVLLMMKHGQIVPSLHSENLNPLIDFEGFQFKIPKQIYPWYAIQNQFRMACINCFGFGGTNSHAVIKQTIDRKATDNVHEKTKHPVIVTLSGQTPSSLKQTIAHFQASVNNGGHALLDIAYTSTLRRDHFRYRVAYTCKSHVELSKKCSASINKLNENHAKVEIKRHCFFVFCGVGTTWTGMCKEMLSYPVFEDTLSKIDKHLEKLSGWSIKKKLSDQEAMENSMICHIAIFACQVGLTKVWESFGIIPDAVVGQSVGEVASAYVAGYLSLEDAVRVIYFRSLLLSMAEGGVMMVVRNCPVDTVQTLCREVKSGSVNIAVHSSPVACTVSGDAVAIEELKNNVSGLIQDTPPICTHLDVKCAYHSRHVQESAGKIAKALNDMKTYEPKLTAYSTVTGDVASRTVFATNGYWEENVKSEVKFSQALRNMASEKGVNVFIEVGPKPVLRAHLNDIFPDRNCQALPSMHPSGEISTMYQTVADLFQIGFDPKWEALYPQRFKLVDIPRYTFDRRELRVESEYKRLRCEGINDNKSHHKLLKSSSKSTENFKVDISQNNTSFVYSHIIDGAIIVPGALYAEVALELGTLVMLSKPQNIVISYDILNFVAISQGTSCELEVAIKSKSDNSGALTFSISHIGNTVAEGSVLCNKTGQLTSHCPISQILKSCQKSIEAEDIYSELERIGYTYKPPVQVIRRLVFNESESLAEINLTEDVMKTENRYLFHPAVLDGMLHPLLLLFMRNCKTPNMTKIYPVRIGSLVRRLEFEKNMFCYSRNIQARDNRIISNFLLTDENGNVIAEVKEMEFKIVDDTVPLDSVIHDVQWTPVKTESLSSQVEFETHEIQIVSLQEDVLKELKSIFPECNTRHVQYDANNENSFEETQNLFKSIFDDKSLSLIIFANGKENCQTNKESFDAICKTCHVFLCIARVFNPKIPLLVLTENTQNVPGSQIKNPNIFGAELWGYVRSLRLETSFPVSLLDIQSSQNSKNSKQLRAFVRNVKDVTLSHSTDVVLTDKQMFYYSYLHSSERKGVKPEYKTTNIDDKRFMELRSTTHNALQEPFFVPCEEIQENGKGVLLRVQSATHLQVVPSDKNISRSIWSESEDSGFPVLANEYCGIKVQSKTLQSPLTEQKRYAACFPERCSSLVTIPTECICDLQKLPSYKPGIITSFVTAWFIFQNITGPQTVYIVNQEPEQTPEGIILIEILKQKRGNMILFSPEQFLNSPYDKDKTVVFLTNSMIDEISKKLHNVKSIIGFSDVISESTKRVLILQKNGVKCLYRAEIFDPKTLKSSFPVIRAFMEKNCSILEKATPYLKTEEVHLIPLECNPNSNLSLRLKPQHIVRHDASYIVVGGLTGLGWEVVKWLARMGAGAVITMSRSKPNSETIEKIQNVIDLYRIRIVTVQCDVGCLGSVKKAVKDLHKMTDLPLKGVYQGAGVLRDGYIKSMTKDKIDEVLYPKILGTLNLHEATLHLSLDQFVMQSSVASVLGNPGQTNYSAANAFLDAFSHFRRSQNLHSQSVNWGALDVGMVGNNVAIRDQLENMGNNPLNKKQIKLALSDAVLRNEVQTAYASIDFKKLGVTYQTQKVNSEIKKAIGENKSMMFDAVAFDMATPKEKLDQTLDLILECISKVLSIEESDVDQDSSLVKQGLESQQATEFIQLVYKATGCKVPIAYAISPQYSVKDIAEFAASQITEKHTSSKENEILKRSISFFEKAIMDIIPNGDNIELSIAYDVTEFTPTEEMWKDIFRFVTLKYPELRTIFMRDRHRFAYSIEKIILEPEDVVVNFKVAPSYPERKDDSDETPIETEFHSFTQYETPVKIYFIPRGKKHRLQISFNPFSFDLESVFLLTMEMCQLAEEVKSKRCLPEMKELPENDVSFLTDKTLKEVGIDLKRFWGLQVSDVSMEATLSKADKSLLLMKGSISRDLSVMTVKHLANAEIDESKLFCCLYGLLLSKITSAPSIPIICANNVRRYLKELDRRIFMGTNFFPAVLTIVNQDMTLRDYVNSAAAIFDECEKYGLYPYELIKELTASQPNPFKHQFNYRTLPMTLNGCSNRGYRLERCSFNFPTMTDMETCLNVSNCVDKGIVELRLDYDKGILDCDQAEILLGGLLDLIRMFVEEPGTKVKDYHPQSLQLQQENLESETTCVTAL